MLRKIMMGFVFLSAVSFCSLARACEASFAVTDLGTLGGEMSVACGLNDRGKVVGFSSLANGESHAFLWSDCGMTDLGTLPDLGFSTGRNINNSGQVVGDSTAQFLTPPYHAVFWKRNREIVPLGTLGGAAGFAVDINSRGQVVGAARDGSGQLHAFRWQDGVMTDLGTLPGHVLSVARGINRRGQAVGNSEAVETPSIGLCPTNPAPVQAQHRAVLWDDQGMTDLGTLGGVFGLAKGINDRGQVVGSSSLANGEEHAFLWSEGVMTDLGTLGGGYSLANRINNRGRIVGLSKTSDEEVHAVLWQGGVMTDLNSLIPADSGWVLVEATDINRYGEIVGLGTISGETHAFLLTPVEGDE